MVTPVRIDPRARDISIELNNSCNCCCFGWLFRKVTREDTPVYVNSDGLAVKFDFKKMQSEIESLQRTVSNINRHIEQLAVKHEQDVQTAKQQIEKLADVSLNEENPPQITLGMLERINAAIRSIFEIA